MHAANIKLIGDFTDKKDTFSKKVMHTMKLNEFLVINRVNKLCILPVISKIFMGRFLGHSLCHNFV